MLPALGQIARTAFLLGSITGLAATGCQRSATTLAPRKAPEVIFTTPATKSVLEFEEFTGRTEAVRTVELRARVSGYLDKALFKDGADVKEGDLLFEIDPRSFDAEVERAASNLALADARLTRLEADYQRAASMFKQNAIAEEEYVRISADRAEGQASVKVAQAGLRLAKLNLSFTKVTAPVSGRISRRMIDPGNLVKADDTLLTVIVVRNPMYAYFDVDERTLLRLRRLVREGKMPSARETKLPIELGLPDEDGYSIAGAIDFADNRILSNTGTLRVRGEFPNDHGLLSPGLFVRVRMPIGDPRSALVIPEQALATDQGQKYVYVLDGQNVVQYRKVRVGHLQDGLRVIDEGLRPGERFVVGGLQRVRPGMTVDPKPMEPLGKDREPASVAGH